MNDLTRYLVESFVNEYETGVTVILPGGFKPPHGGHLDLAVKYSKLPQVREVLILVGPKSREGITREQSISIWNTLLAGNPVVKVQSVSEDNPLTAAYKFIETAKPGTYALAASSKGSDYTRVKSFVTGHTQGAKYYRSGVNVVELPLDTKPLLYKNRSDEYKGKGISASVLRSDLADKNYENFKTNYPGQPENVVKKVYSILTKQQIKEAKLRVFDFDDTLVKTNNVIYVKKSDGRVIPLTSSEYATYKPDEKDILDFSDFNSPIKSAEELTQYMNILKRTLKAQGTDRRVVVLTARSNASVVYDFLMKLGIRVPVIAVGSSDPMKKVEWIEKQINSGYDDIYFLDDSPKNINAVQTLSNKYPNIKIKTQIVAKANMPAQNYLRESALLTEGGAAGHLAHPYEDIDLTFSDVQNMIDAALSGKLENAQEKLDGQNLMVTYKDGKVRAARNKTQLKNYGENSLTANQVKQVFAGRGSIESAFGEAMQDLQKAINKLTDQEKADFFENGKKFISLEILYPDTTNVIPYGASQIRMHHFKEYDESGNVIGEDVAGIYKLEQALAQAKAEVQKTFKIKTTDPAKIGKDLDFEAQKKYFLAKLKAIQAKYGLKDTDKMGLYFQAWWKEFIESNAKNYKYKLPAELLQNLVNRWGFSNKTVPIGEIKKQITNPDFLAWVEEFDKTNVAPTKKVAIQPIENLFLELGVRVLKNVQNLVALNPDKSLSDIVANVNNAIEQIKNTKQDLKGTDASLIFLKRELKRLKDIGGFKAILPTEGLVYQYNGKLYKLTGAFAPINQILGYLRF